MWIVPGTETALPGNSAAKCSCELQVSKESGSRSKEHSLALEVHQYKHYFILVTEVVHLCVKLLDVSVLLRLTET